MDGYADNVHESSWNGNALDAEGSYSDCRDTSYIDGDQADNVERVVCNYVTGISNAIPISPLHGNAEKCEGLRLRQSLRLKVPTSLTACGSDEVDNMEAVSRDDVEIGSSFIRAHVHPLAPTRTHPYPPSPYLAHPQPPALAQTLPGSPALYGSRALLSHIRRKPYYRASPTSAHLFLLVRIASALPEPLAAPANTPHARPPCCALPTSADFSQQSAPYLPVACTAFVLQHTTSIPTVNNSTRRRCCPIVLASQTNPWQSRCKTHVGWRPVGCRQVCSL